MPHAACGTLHSRLLFSGTLTKNKKTSRTSPPKGLPQTFLSLPPFCTFHTRHANHTNNPKKNLTCKKDLAEGQFFSLYFLRQSATASAYHDE